MDDRKGWKQQLRDIRDRLKTWAASRQGGPSQQGGAPLHGAGSQGGGLTQQRYDGEGRSGINARVPLRAEPLGARGGRREEKAISADSVSETPRPRHAPPISIGERRSVSDIGTLHRPKIKIRAPARTDGTSWQDVGRRTQFDGTERADILDLVIGLDFGTAFTKVIIGESRARYAIPFEQRVATRNPYLLPGVLTIGADGECHLGEVSNARAYYSDLKLSLLAQDRTVERCALVAAYLALVLRHVRAWFQSNLSDVYGRNRINWLVNVGLPSDPWHDWQLKELYKQIAWAAWELSVAPGRVTLDAAREAYRTYPQSNCNGESLRSPEQISVIPEVIAQITSYAKSPRREDDLHLLVDIGAGTVDVTTFNVHSDKGDDVYPLFAAKVLCLGTHFLLNEILVSPERSVEWDDSQPFPSVDVIVERLRVDAEVVRGKMKKATSRFVGAVGDVLAKTKKNRYRGSRHWKDGIPVFICGGGANVPFYRNALRRLNRPTEYPMRVIQMERPDILKAPGLNAQDFHRLSVAYGLSFDAFDIGRIRPIDDTPDDDPPPAGPSYTDAYVSKDLT